MEGLCALTDKLTVKKEKKPGDHRPCVKVCREDGSWTGLAFHGVPGGHEFTSFILGLYNASGPGQSLEEETRLAIGRITRPVYMKILVSPVLHHVPGPGDGRPADRGGKSKCNGGGLRPESFPGLEGSISCDERPVSGGE